MEENGKESNSNYEKIGNVLVIQPLSDLDHHLAVPMRKEADRKIEDGNCLHLVFDFSKIHFMDSSGIGVIMGRYKNVIFRGGRIACCAVTPEIDRILSLSGLYRIMPCYQSKTEAVHELLQTRGGK